VTTMRSFDVYEGEGDMGELAVDHRHQVRSDGSGPGSRTAPVLLDDRHELGEILGIGELEG
jgi:hypothetical protein